MGSYSSLKSYAGKSASAAGFPLKFSGVHRPLPLPIAPYKIATPPIIIGNDNLSHRESSASNPKSCRLAEIFGDEATRRTPAEKR
jgi:hypothetical protein